MIRVARNEVLVGSWSSSPSAECLGPKRNSGRAMMTTPMRAMIPAARSFLERIVFKKMEQSQAVMMGTRKRMTVDSARGR